MATDTSFKGARGVRSSEPARPCRRLEPDMPRGDRPQLSQPLCDRALQKTAVYKLRNIIQALFPKKSQIFHQYRLQDLKNAIIPPQFMFWAGEKKPFSLDKGQNCQYNRIVKIDNRF